MLCQPGDLVVFTHVVDNREVEKKGKVVEFTFNSPDPELVVRDEEDGNLLRKHRYQVRLRHSN